MAEPKPYKWKKGEAGVNETKVTWKPNHSNSDNLKERIEQILCDGNDDLVPPISYQNVLDELLHLFQDYAKGYVPPEPENYCERGDDRWVLNLHYIKGYNQCRQDILNNLEGKS